jgi:hypothetical protein
MKYRKKPVVIEATQFWPDKKPHPEGVEEFIQKQTEDVQGYKSTLYGWRVTTLEGPLIVSAGDWIITGVKGEKYPCKPDVFEMTYEQVDG